MNTSSASMNMRTAAVDKGMWHRSINDLIVLPSHVALQTVPVKARLRAVAIPANRRQRTTTKTTRSVWIPLPNEAVGEKILLGLLALAAAASIAYGFMNLLDYVQNWTVINAWVARLLSA